MWKAFKKKGINTTGSKIQIWHLQKFCHISLTPLITDLFSQHPRLLDLQFLGAVLGQTLNEAGH